MKVVLFCGGLGMRLRSFSDHIPKPLVEIGSRPILWHLMKYYAHFGHREFILCLGHGGNAIKSYFLKYDECVSNDFVLSEGGRKVELLKRDIDDWRVTFVDTGPYSSIGQRLRAVRSHLEDEELFLANYSDGLSGLDLDAYLQYFQRRRRVACFLSVAAPHTFHIVEADPDHTVRRLQAVGRSPVRINGGFFAFRREIFDYIREGEDLVFEPFERLIADRELLAYPYDGFWRNMDTFKDKQQLDDLLDQGVAPWQVWLSPGASATLTPPPPLQPADGRPGIESELADVKREVLQELQAGKPQTRPLETLTVVRPERAAPPAGGRRGES
jgi:glucose-1-phosphate cytidylyltransferase